MLFSSLYSETLIGDDSRISDPAEIAEVDRIGLDPEFP
jgi:hypothetical protein